MDAAKPTNSLSSEHEKGCTIQRWVLILIVAVAAFCVIILGLLVGHLSLKPKKEEQLYVRLPRSIVPEHYDLELQPYIIPDNFTYDGKVKILIRVLEVTDNVTLHINNVTVNDKSVQLTDVKTGKAVHVSSTSEDEEREFYILHLQNKLTQGMYEIYMEFVGSLNGELEGFYRSSYTDSHGNKSWLATTQFEPTNARRAFPCFDEPALKATFNITLVHWTNMTSLSNMPIYKTEMRGSDWVADYFQKTVKMSTYVLAFVVSDYSSAGTPEFSVWSRSDILNTTAYAQEVGPKILRFYETFFHIKYPLPKMDMVAIPDFSQVAMENWGLITYQENALLYDKRYSSASKKLSVASVISHELAHQWFGNLVTPDWWDDLWLNEGFADYIQYLGVHAVEPDWKMDEIFVLNELQDVMDSDCLKTSHAVSLPVRHPDEINEIFDEISYEKGASIIRMMKFFLGERNFHAGLTNYLNVKKFKNAVQDDLWKELTVVQDKANRIDVKTVMDSWTLQTGYPVVEVIRNYTSHTAQVKQYRFLLEKDDSGKEGNVQWEVPFTYTDALNDNWNPTTKLWLHKKNGSISRLPNSKHWIIGNVQEVGYYKVNYDEHNWKLLIQQLMDDHTKIHSVNRAQIIDDALDLARAGQLSYRLALNTTMYLKNEEEYLPWKSALDSFSFIDSMICRSDVYGKWQTYIIDQLTPMYESLGWEESEDEGILRQYMRVSTIVWMCDAGHNDCIKRAQEKFEQWKNDTTNFDIIPPNLRSVVFCTAVQYGGQEVWNFMWERYKTEKHPSEKFKLMSSLACATEPWLLTRYLNWSITDGSGIPSVYGSYVFRSVGAKVYGRDLTFDFIRDRWNAILNRYEESSAHIVAILQSITSSFNTQFELTQLQDFFKLRKDDLKRAEISLDEDLTSVEVAKSNMKWMSNNYAQLVDWLEMVK